MTVENIKSVTRNDYEESNTGGISIEKRKQAVLASSKLEYFDNCDW